MKMIVVCLTIICCVFCSRCCHRWNLTQQSR